MKPSHEAYKVNDEVIVKVDDPEVKALREGAPGRVVELIAAFQSRHLSNRETWYRIAFEPPLVWPNTEDKVTHMECRPDMLLPRMRSN